MSSRSPIVTLHILLLLLALLQLASPIHAAEQTTAAPVASKPKIELTPAETKFVALAAEFHQKLDGFWEKLAEFTDRDAAIEFDSQHDPGIEYLPKFLEFEGRHTGEDAGLHALGEIVNYAARSGDPESYRASARREALQRLEAYEDRELTIIVVENLTSGAYDPQVLDYLRRLGDSSDANDTLRAFARLTYAEKMLSLRAARRQSSTQLQDFAAGMTSDYPNQEEHYRDFLNCIPPAAELDARADDAIPLLEELAASGAAYKLPAFRIVDSASHLIHIDPDQQNSNPPPSAKAAALLFQERHLRPGEPAPDIELELIDGGTWKLADQRGRVVVIQFSFTGCGPCAAMYPDLCAMEEELGGRLSLITIMRDSTPEYALAAKKEGKITWDVACDGVPGTVCTRWAVDSFPTIYVIDPAGNIVAVGPRGKQLRWKVEQLLTPAGE